MQTYVGYRTFVTPWPPSDSSAVFPLMFGSHTVGGLLAEAALVLGLLAAAVFLYRRYTRSHRAASAQGGTAAAVPAEHVMVAEHATNDGLWYWDRRRDVAHFSPRWKELLGFGDSDIGSSSAEWFSRIHPADTERVQLELYSHICGESPHFESRHRLLDAEGNYRLVFTRGLAVRDEDGVVSRIGGSLTDLSRILEAGEATTHHAMHDDLTGLSTRAYFMDMLDRSAARAARREGYQFAVLFVDLDGFKTVNDTLGHAVGDELLVTVARKLEACVRPGDVVARLGGDEFTILLDDIENGSDATRIAARIIASLRRPAIMGSAEVNLDGSIGIALSEGVGTGEELLRSADLAMYRAKRRGRGRYEVFDRAMHSEAVARLRLESELRNAVDRREFELFYQPVVDPSEGMIRSAEVLMRWNHPERGVLPADEFITVANETGLIVTLGTWMLREACHQVATWQAMFPARPPLSLSVNFCRREMQNPDLLLRVEKLLEETGLQARTLRIEVTENGIAESYDASPRTYHDLERLGVGFQIDDFGTGSASLSLLHRFPVSAVKIDRSFVYDIADSEESRQVVRYIAAVATAMGVEVIAEGVETAQQESWLRELGCCALAQGYRYSKPVDAAEFEGLLAAQARERLGELRAG